MAKILFGLATRLTSILGISICVLCAGIAQAQTPPANQDDINKQLLERIHELESKVEQLEAKGSGTIAAPVALPAPAPVPETPPVVELPPVNVVADRLKLLFFGDTGFQTGRFYGPTNTFEFGEFDMFATAHLSDKVSVLGELLFNTNPDNTINIDIERLVLKYRHNDYFSASIGRIHTAIGYYNTAFNRGDYFQTSTGRPTMFEFDNQGGFLPLQDLGIVFEGQIPSGRLGLNYVFEVTNGRDLGAEVEPSQNASDHNNSKAVNFGLSAKPDKIPGLIVGFSIRHDYLSDALNLRVAETIPVFYAVFTNSKYEWLNEGMFVTHTLPGGGTFHTPGLYTQFSRKFGHYRPYFKYDYVNAPLNDPIYGNPAEIDPVGRVNGPSLGLRWDFTTHSAVKLQYQREGLAGVPSTNGGNAQFDFTF